MGILDRYTSDEDREELAKNLEIAPDEKSPIVKTDNNLIKRTTSTKRSAVKRTENKPSEPDDELLAISSEFVRTYKENTKTSRMIRIQDAHYRQLVSLRADGISVSEFISFAVHFTLRSKDYESIINILKQ